MGTQSREGLTMVHILTSVTLVLVSLELSLAAPFLLDLLPQITIGRREGKGHVDSGYGAPESSAYEAPKPSYSSTTTTTTVTPCSYKAPTTTSAPSYGAPEQKKAGFPDILGFIGGILKPKKAPEPSNGYGAPQSDAYEAPCLSPPVDSGYEAPQSDAYKAPQSDAYEAPQSDSYEAPDYQGVAVNERSNVPSE